MNYQPMIIEGLREVKDGRRISFAGEINNSNDMAPDGAVVTIIFRSNDRKILGGKSGMQKDVRVNGKTPFDILWVDRNHDIAYASYEAYVRESGGWE
jgi:hypothetical protein